MIYSCKNCPNRSAECHSTCDIYKRENEAHTKLREDIQYRKKTTYKHIPKRLKRSSYGRRK